MSAFYFASATSADGRTMVDVQATDDFTAQFGTSVIMEPVQLDVTADDPEWHAKAAAAATAVLEREHWAHHHVGARRGKVRSAR